MSRELELRTTNYDEGGVGIGDNDNMAATAAGKHGYFSGLGARWNCRDDGYPFAAGVS